MKSFTQHLEHLLKKKTNLSVRQLYVVIACSTENHTVRGLAQIMGVSKPAITRSVDWLETLGFVARKVDPEDRRSVILTATAAGKKFAKEMAA